MALLWSRPWGSMSWTGWRSPGCSSSPRCHIAFARLLIEVSSPAGGGDDHVTVWSGSRDGSVPPKSVIVFLVHKGHISEDPSGLPLANVQKRSIQCITNP